MSDKPKDESLKVAPLTPEGRERVERVLQRALDDIEFRERLLEDPEAALSDDELDAVAGGTKRRTGLTKDEKKMLGSMHRVALEEWGLDVRKFRAFMRDNGFKVGGPS